MVRLRNRQTGIPNGYRFYVPSTKWTPRSNSSFQGIVESLYRHMQGNPAVLKSMGWQLDMNFLADKVDEFNANLCQKMGWTDYIVNVSEAAGGQPRRPFPRASAESAAAAVASASPGDVRPRKKSCCGGRLH